MNAVIAQAVHERRILSFTYEDLPRIVEAHLYGIHRDTGNEVLSAYQVGGASRSRDPAGWRFFLVSEIQHLAITERVFTQTRPGYNQSDPRLKIVIARA